MDIICIAGNLYDQELWTNRQRITTIMANSGNRVLYVEPPKSILLQAIKLFLRRKLEQKPQLWFKRLVRAEQRQENLYLFSLMRFFPIKYRKLRKFNYLLNLIRMKREIERLQISNSVLWIYTPDAVTCVGRLGEKVVCYDCVDDYKNQPYYYRSFKGIEEDEEELLNKADIVFTTNSNLYKEKRKFNSNTYLTPNVGDYKHFIKSTNPATPIPDDIRCIAHPIIGFIGAIDELKLDIELLLYLAQSRPNYSIVLIGPTGVSDKGCNLSTLRNFSNIYILGFKNYKDLPGYMKNFDVCIIPYRSNSYTKNCFPIKFFEYLASGKPVVVSGLPELKQYKGIIGFANNKEEFIILIDEIVHSNGDFGKEKRVALASKNTWEGKAAMQVKIVENFIIKRNIK